MPSLSTSKIKEYLDGLTSIVETKREEIEFFSEQIITLDAEKGPINELIEAVDNDIISKIDAVNDKLKEVQNAYQARIDGGSRTDLFWRIVGVTSAAYTTASVGRNGSATSIKTSPASTTYVCTRLDFNGYAGLTGVTTRPLVPNEDGKYPITNNSTGWFKGQERDTSYTEYLTKSEFNKRYPKGSSERIAYFSQYPYGIGVLLHPDDNDGTGSPTTPDPSTGLIDFLLDEPETSSSYYPPDTKIGYRSDNLHAIKYYDEPRTNDLVDSTITSFEGYISVGSTILNVVSAYNSGALYDVKPKQLVIVGGTSLKVFPQGYAEIVSIGTTLGNLSSSVSLIQAEATSQASAEGKIVSINVTNPGFGYTSSPNVAVPSPIVQTATATATIGSGGTIGNLTITNPGSGYTSNPSVAISPPGEKATATSTISADGLVSTISIASSGFGYVTKPSVTIQTFGVQSVGFATTSVTGEVSAINLTTLGVGYTFNPPPQVIVESPVSGTTAIATANVNSSGVMTSITLTNVGSGYTFNPVVQISPPTEGLNATATSKIKDGQVTDIIITNPGSGYVVNPTILISPPGGIVSAAATATINAVGQVIDLKITNPGSGYTSINPPFVAILPPEPGITATAVANVSSGVVTSISITNPGFGYTSGSKQTLTIDPPFSDVIQTLTLDTPVAVGIGTKSPVEFDVLISASTLTGIITDLSVDTTLNPFSPQSIGIMNSSKVGMGTFIVYDNSGKSPTKKTWRPELESDALGDKGTPYYVPAVKEPVVGSGLIWYKKGFKYKPVKFKSANPYLSLFGIYGTSKPDDIETAKEGDKITVYEGQKDYLLEKLPNNPDLNNILDEKIKEAQDAISDLKNSTGVLNSLISVANTLRISRDDKSLDIWSKRNLIGHLQKEISDLENQFSLVQSNSSILTT